VIGWVTPTDGMGDSQRTGIANKKGESYETME
jgi:hypothetical protein